MAIQEGCPACEESLPFYRRVTVQDTKEDDVQIVVAVPDHNTGIAVYLESHQIEPDAVVFLTGPHQLPTSAAPNHLGGIASRSVPTHTTSTLTSLSPSASPDPGDAD